jgi:hypothetical protein
MGVALSFGHLVVGAAEKPLATPNGQGAAYYFTLSPEWSLVTWFILVGAVFVFVWGGSRIVRGRQPQVIGPPSLQGKTPRKG